MSASKRLTKVFETSEELFIDKNTKIVLMSDCHRGVGNWGDNFTNNQNLFFAALNYYYENKFTYIELGDGDELWENRDMDKIIYTHSDAFWLISNLYRAKRFHMLYGNHDIEKRDLSFRRKYLRSYIDESQKKRVPLLPGIKIHEGLILTLKDTNHKVFLIHGHQVDFLNNDIWRIARFLVRYLWRPIELLGIRNPTSASDSFSKKEKIEKKLNDWAKEQQHILIAGHTHRPVFPEPGRSLYFNDGSCVHPRCITGIEIENGNIVLVKWSIRTRTDRSLYVDRVILEGPVAIEQYFKEK
jgi:predicted phosphodiesterase